MERNAGAEKVRPENVAAPPAYAQPPGDGGGEHWGGRGLGLADPAIFKSRGAVFWREGCLRAGARTARTNARSGLAVSVTVKQPVWTQDAVILNEPGRRAGTTRRRRRLGTGGPAKRVAVMGRL